MHDLEKELIRLRENFNIRLSQKIHSNNTNFNDIPVSASVVQTVNFNGIKRLLRLLKIKFI